MFRIFSDRIRIIWMYESSKELGNVMIGLNVKQAEVAIVEGLQYLKNRLGWSGAKIASIVHLPTSTIYFWLKNGAVSLAHDSSIDL